MNVDLERCDEPIDTKTFSPASALTQQQTLSGALGQLQTSARMGIGRLEPPPRPPSREPATLRAIEVFADGSFADQAALIRASVAIESRAAELGRGAEDARGPITAVAGGFVGRYQGQDIYYSPHTGVHEVHGDIKLKYDALSGPAGLLGLPMTDERVTPDTIGRYNHFVGGSIYWTPHTGPMAVRGAIRQKWAEQGWERGQLGYPVRDQYRMIPRFPMDPVIEWCFFENGCIASDPTGAKGTCPVGLPAAVVADLVRTMVDEEMHRSPENVGLHPGIQIVNVSGWGYGFWLSNPRTISYRLHGFRDNGLLPDTDFFIDIDLKFAVVAAPYSFTEPVDKSLVASLEFLRVRYAGGPPVISGHVIAGVAHAIHAAFFPETWPREDNPEVPNGALFLQRFETGANPPLGLIDVLGALTTATGDLQLLLNPLNPLSPPNPPPNPILNPDYCQVRQTFAQLAIDELRPPN